MRRVFYALLAALTMPAGCKEDPVPTPVDGAAPITTIAAARSYLERQLAGEVLVRSTTALTDRTPGGWRVEFTGGSPATVDLANGTGGTRGLTPKLVVRHNADGSTTLWEERDNQLVETRVTITGPIEAPIEPGEVGVPPKLDVRRAEDGTLSVWYNDIYGYPDGGWKNTGYNIQSGSGTGSEEEIGPVLAIIDNEARGVVAFWLDDKEHTSYTFDKFSPAMRFNIMSDDVRIEEGATSPLVMVVSPSDAWIPTGVGEWIDRWELNDPDVHGDTRAGYVQKCPYTQIESILHSGNGLGEYVVTLRNTTSNLNTFDTSDVHALVLNTNTERVPKLMSSTRFNLHSRLPRSANSVVVAPGGTVELSMAQIIREYYDGFVSAMRVSPSDDVTAHWEWADSPGTGTPAGAVSAIEVVTPPESGLNTRIRVTAGAREGNVVVAARVGGTTVWSWHVWVTRYDPETLNHSYHSGGETRLSAPDAGKPHTFMDRNLGALANSYTPGSKDYSSFGMYYQWGRKDPLPGLYNSEPVIYVPTPGGGEEATNMPLASPAMTAGVRYSVEHPGEFIYTPSSLTGFWSWNDLSAQSLATLWYDGTDVSYNISKSVYDPCPVGWRLPSKGVLEGFSPSEDKQTVSLNMGFRDTPYGFIPLAGYMDYLGRYQPSVGMYAFYTSQKDIPLWYSRWADGVRYETTGGSENSKFASSAISVRCIQES
jgi:hypothetical protein